jgi:hypothetical protein
MAVFLPAISFADGSELPGGSKILDADVYMYSWPYPSISPNGKWVAYVSQGYVCVCNLETPKPLRIKEVPHSWTWPHLKAPAGHSPATGAFDTLSRGLSREERNYVHRQIMNTIYGLNWTHDSHGFVFGVQTHDTKKIAPICEVYLATVEGHVTRLVHVGSDALTRTVNSGTLTRDGKYLIATERQLAHPDYRPLIWDVKQNRPRATPFLTLVPSSTSGRWIGIEKNTRQLVIIDDRFEVVQRLEEFVPDRSHGFKLDWSPDERFIVWRNQIGFDHFSNWKGFRKNLQTGEKIELEGRYMDENIEFTGRGGEFFRCGQTGAKTRGYDTTVGAHLTLISDNGSSTSETDVWRITVDPTGKMPGALTNRPGNPPLHYDDTTGFFAIGLPRPAGQRSGFNWHVMDRAGKTWRVPGEDNGEYISPFEVAGFADGGKLLVAYDKMRLFTVPVTSIMNAANEVERE